MSAELIQKQAKELVEKVLKGGSIAEMFPDERNRPDSQYRKEQNRLRNFPLQISATGTEENLTAFESALDGDTVSNQEGPWQDIIKVDFYDDENSVVIRTIEGNDDYTSSFLRRAGFKDVVVKDLQAESGM